MEIALIAANRAIRVLVARQRSIYSRASFLLSVVVEFSPRLSQSEQEHSDYLAALATQTLRASALISNEIERVNMFAKSIRVPPARLRAHEVGLLSRQAVLLDTCCLKMST